MWSRAASAFPRSSWPAPSFLPRSSSSGALYLVWLGIKTLSRVPAGRCRSRASLSGDKRAFRDGVLVEALNPKTAAFFLAFIPQFLDPAGASPTLQFIVLGAISVTLNTLADVVVVLMASATRTQLIGRPYLMRRLTQGSGVFIAGLGLSLALARAAGAGLAEPGRLADARARSSIVYWRPIH